MPDLPNLTKFLEDQEYDYLQRTMEMTHGRVKAAARLAGRAPERFYKKLLSYGIKAREYRGIYHCPEWHEAHRKKQGGFIFGGIYVYLGMAIAAAALAGVCYLAGRSDGRDIERSVWAEQQNSDLREANRALDAAHKAARDQEQEAARKVAAVSSTYQRDLANANRTKDLAMAALRSGALVLRDPVASSPPVSGGTAEAPACACGRDGPPGGVLSASASRVLSGEASRFLIALASEADVVATQLQACQALVRADRGG